MEKKVKDFVYNYAKRMEMGQLPVVNFNFLLKKGFSKKDIYESLVDYALENNINHITAYFNEDGITELLQHDDTKEKVVKLFKKYWNSHDIDNEFFKILEHSNFNFYFFVSLKEHFINRAHENYVNFLIKDAVENGKATTENFKKLFYNLFEDDYAIRTYISILKTHLHKLDKSLQNFIVGKTEFVQYFSANGISNLINSGLPLDIAKKLIDKFITEEVTGGEVYELYNSLLEEYRKLLFKTSKEYYDYLDKFTPEEKMSLIDSHFDRDEIENFFQYNTDYSWVDHLDIDQKIELKFAIENIPEGLKEKLNFPMTAELIFTGNEIKKMFASYRDSPSDWVEYYIDETLYEHTISWDYSVSNSDVKSYYWDTINETNLNEIKEKIKQKYPDVDVEDEDELQNAALDDDDIGSTLRSAASDGQRSGDESKLIEDIKKGIDEIFGKGKWKHINVDKIEAIADLSEFTSTDLYYAYRDCGNWDIGCMFYEIRKGMESRDKPSLPEYRYGIQGDFDDNAFNESISDNL